MVGRLFVSILLILGSVQSLEGAIIECAETVQRIASLKDLLEVSPSQMFMGRGLWTKDPASRENFETHFTRKPVQELLSLSPQQRWLNIGGGNLQAEADLRARKGDQSPEIVSINVHKINSQAPWPKSIENFMREPRKFVGQKLVVHDQAYIEKIDPEDFGKFDIITDLFSASAYSPHLDFVIYQMGQLALPHAKIYISGFNPEFSSRKLRSAWLEKIRGFKILEDNIDQRVPYRKKPRYKWLFQNIRKLGMFQNDMDHQGIRLVLQRTSEPMSVPTLKLQFMRFNTPPIYSFEEYGIQDGPVPAMQIVP